MAETARAWAQCYTASGSGAFSLTTLAGVGFSRGYSFFSFSPTSFLFSSKNTTPRLKLPIFRILMPGLDFFQTTVRTKAFCTESLHSPWHGKHATSGSGAFSLTTLAGVGFSRGYFLFFFFYGSHPCRWHVPSRFRFQRVLPTPARCLRPVQRLAEYRHQGLTKIAEQRNILMANSAGRA